MSVTAKYIEMFKLDEMMCYKSYPTAYSNPVAIVDTKSRDSIYDLWFF